MGSDQQPDPYVRNTIGGVEMIQNMSKNNGRSALVNRTESVHGTHGMSAETIRCANGVSTLLIRLLQTSALVIVSAGSGVADAKKLCTDLSCSISAASPAKVKGQPATLADAGYAISVDGERLDGAGASTISDTENADIQIKFDGLDVKPQLNISIAQRSETQVTFHTASNYSAWIAKAEVRIVERAKSGEPQFLASVPVVDSGEAIFERPQSKNQNLAYSLRVYDTQGRFDETQLFALGEISENNEALESGDAIGKTDSSEDQSLIRNIPVYGGAVTVSGTRVASGNKVTALGKAVPVDVAGKFVTQQILPAGEHDVDVTVHGKGDERVSFKRSITIPANDWFYVALADLTIGKSFGNGKLVSASPQDYDRVYSKGRLAFYIKGKIQGKYLLTAAADTGAGDVRTLFKNLDSKDPRKFLGRIDPEQFYPVYGDDSSSIEDAPTRGKFYVRLERGDSHVLWGNFKSTVTGAKLIRNERAYYGANGVYRSEDTTSFGERKIEASAYAAQAGTLPQRDVLRGTGGSAYFLKRQDVVAGSETISIESKDPVSGRVTSRRQLVAGQDYDFDAVQGIIILRQPLSATEISTGAVTTTTNNIINLVAQYEYTPTVGQADGYSYGGRAQAWAGEHVRLGATGMSEKTGNADQRLVGADVLLRHSDMTFLRVEVAQSQGPGFGRSLSSDGGLTLNDEAATGIRGKTARAYTLEGQADLAEISGDRLSGQVSGHLEKKARGFSTLDEDIAASQTSWGLTGKLDITKGASLEASYEDFADASGKHQQEAKIDGVFALSDKWQARVGVDHVDAFTPTGPVDKNGQRTDIGARITYSPSEGKSAYLFGQATVDKAGGIFRNDRAGVGATAKLTGTLGLTGQISYGTSGIGAAAGITYDPNTDNNYYLEYRLDPNRTVENANAYGTDLGGVVMGAKRRYNDVLLAFAENNYDMFGRRRSLNSTYGVTFTPDSYWTVTGGLEAGQISEKLSSDFNRQAASFSIGYKDGDELAARIRGEVRLEDSKDHSKDRQTYLTAATLSWKTDENWRFIANLDAVISHSDQSSILNGRYVEAGLGFAYRPVDNDRFNALVKYRFLYDLPGSDQVNANGNILGPAQRSHIFSADASYDLNEYLTVGAKYGFRVGQVSSTRGASDFVASSAQLGIIRADVHVVHNWDALLEARVLTSPGVKTTSYGALAAVYRHFGDTMKVGVGYNFGTFSDDLADLTYDDQGVFLNVAGTF